MMDEVHDGHVDADEQPFPFIGNALALDLINTDVIVRGRRRDLLSTPAAAAAWWAVARRRYPDAVAVAGEAAADDRWRDEATRAELVRLRAGLRAALGAVAADQPVGAADLEPINRILRLGQQELDAVPGGEVALMVRPRDAAASGLLLPIALSAAWLLAHEDRARLRACENDRCVAMFLDTSKGAARRWCSEGCMNRARSARRYAEVKRTSRPA